MDVSCREVRIIFDRFWRLFYQAVPIDCYVYHVLLYYFNAFFFLFALFELFDVDASLRIVGKYGRVYVYIDVFLIVFERDVRSVAHDPSDGLVDRRVVPSAASDSGSA